MISLALSISKSHTSTEAGDASASAPGGEGAKSAFSAVLQSLDLLPSAGEAKLVAPAEEPSTAPASDVRLPVPTKTGKNLPDVAAALADLPADGPADLPAEVSKGSDDRAEIGANVPTADHADLAPLLQAPVTMLAPETPLAANIEPAQPGAHAAPATPGRTDLPLPALAAQAKQEGGEAPSPMPASDTAQAGPKPTHAAAGQATSAAAELSLPAAALLAPARRESGEKAEGRSVAIQVAPEPAAPSSSSQLRTETEVQPAKVREPAVEGLPFAKAAAVEAAPQAPSAAAAQSLPAESSQAGRPVETARPALHSDALQDLTRVVERLAAAREAFAPTAAALAVTHDEFGEISLSFDQQRDGQLAVRLSASDPDAHRAVAAAVGERSAAAATTDSHTGGSQSQAQPRGAAAERDATGGNSAQRHPERQDQAQQRRSARHGSPSGNGDTARAGIFA
ncbi:hypothetical protein GRI75_07955 [Altererythrobacter soli]|uniref:Uncharacterized protein n=1 Tax=Croceibacterium soli TaxID=1739690 RepID=A0A6I4UUT9_9SPHN|nr:hypothetical protein [Croceibacterium soli]MXP41574.1 hypothetical protein [Croceibacterium soli]